jgi:hypothetical protein
VLTHARDGVDVGEDQGRELLTRGAQGDQTRLDGLAGDWIDSIDDAVENGCAD